MPSSPPSNPPLTDAEGNSIIPENNAKCPNCGKRGHVRVKPQGTIRTPDGRHRERICYACKWEFATDMLLPLDCAKCGARDDYAVVQTQNVHNKILRRYKCKQCGHVEPTVEAFPVPDHKVKKPDFSRW
jgi:predicted RNA-binding Zn-ribbon protein involved in translation (DUF1610 family)